MHSKSLHFHSFIHSFIHEIYNAKLTQLRYLYDRGFPQINRGEANTFVLSYYVIANSFIIVLLSDIKRNLALAPLSALEHQLDFTLSK